MKDRELLADLGADISRITLALLTAVGSQPGVDGEKLIEDFTRNLQKASAEDPGVIARVLCEQLSQLLSSSDH